MNRITPFLGAAPGKGKAGKAPKPEKCDAAQVQAWRGFVKDLEAFVSNLKKGATPSGSAQPAPPPLESDCEGVRKLVRQAENAARRVPEARAVAAELEKARAARDARSGYAAGGASDGPTAYPEWTEPTVGNRFADGAVTVNELQEIVDAGEGAVEVTGRTVSEADLAKRRAAKKEIPWGWIAVGGVALVAGVAALRARR